MQTGAMGTAGVRLQGEGVGNGRSAPSPMCSMVSLMTSHSMGQRGAGRGPCAEGRAKRARGSPGDPRCRAEGSGMPQRHAEGAGSSTPGAARGAGEAVGGSGALPAPRQSSGRERGAQAGRVGVGMPPKTTPHCTLHGRTQFQALGQHQLQCSEAAGALQGSHSQLSSCLGPRR